ncbi:MAG: Sec-independent protein translocase protein TatA [Gemmatimonadetes bacterium]|nr:Sec-independent protein translocase protein TatA [Gemmatimonadota bacterium]
MFGEIGLDKLLLLLLVMFLLLFGAKRLPEIGRSLGKGIREFKGSLSGLDEPLPTVATVYDPSVTAAESTVTLPLREPAQVRRLSN